MRVTTRQGNWNAVRESIGVWIEAAPESVRRDGDVQRRQDSQEMRDEEPFLLLEE